MRESLTELCNKFIENRDTLKETFRWDNAYVWPIAAAMLTSKGITAQGEDLIKCSNVLKESVGVFSNFRGYVRLPMVAKLMASPSPKKKMEEALLAYNKLKELFSSSTYLPLAAICITDIAQHNQYETLAQRTREIYDLMKSEHPFLTSAEDSVFAVLLAFSSLSNEQVVRKNEECFTLLKSSFGGGNATQSLSHVLTLFDASPETSCSRVVEIYNSLRSNGRRYSKYQELTVLGGLACLNVDTNQLVCDIMDADDFLSKQKGYGFFGLSKHQRLMHAAMLVSFDYAGNDATVAEASAMHSTICIMAAEQAAICAGVMAAVAASNASSN